MTTADARAALYRPTPASTRNVARVGFVTSIVGPILYHPVLRRQNEILAIGWIAARIIESAFIAVDTSVGWRIRPYRQRTGAIARQPCPWLFRSRSLRKYADSP
jgi:hypothetical protein